MKIKSISCVLTFAVGMLLSSLSYADPVWIDVRSLAEYQADNIKGDSRITHTDRYPLSFKMQNSASCEVNRF